MPNRKRFFYPSQTSWPVIGLVRGEGQGVGGGSGPVATSSFTMAQIDAMDTKRIYQRTTTTGGGQSKGQGTIPITISSATAGTVYARVRDADGSTILQAPYALSNITNGQTTLNVTGVDARLGWFYVDLLDSSGSWKLGTVLVGMGRLIGFAGQSLQVYMFTRTDSSTYASLGVTIDPNCTVLADYDTTVGGTSYLPTIATQAWEFPADVANGAGINGVGVGEFLRRQASMFGVNCGAFGHSRGSTSISEFLTGGAEWTRVLAYINRVGGLFEAFIWGQGHNDSGFSMPPKGYATGLDLLLANLDANNTINFKTYVWTLPNVNSASWGSPFFRSKLRKGAMDWCVANSATYVHMYDIAQSDSVHETGPGAVVMAQHMHRATRAEVGLSSGIGPAPVSAVRSGTTITLTLSDVGQTNLVLAGTPANRIFVFSKGRVNKHTAQSDNRFPVSSVTVTNKTTLSVVLANDPGDGHELDLYVYWPSDGTGTPASDTIRDDRTDGDGITVGRMVQANPTAVQIAAPVPASTINAPPGGYVAATSQQNIVGTSTVFAAGAGGFSNEMTGGSALAAVSTTAFFSPMTVEGWFTCPTLSGSTQVVTAGPAFVGVTSAGKLTSNPGGTTLTGSVTLVAGKRYHFAAQSGPAGRSLYLTNVTDALAGVRDAVSGTTTASIPTTTRYSLRIFGGSFAMTGGGAVDEVAVFQSERYSGTSYVCPTAPFAGTETDLAALYHCDDTTGATTVLEAAGA